MTARHFIIATAGHVDHGKSALVKALTGTDPDRLPEEKARGISIDLGFAELNLTTAAGEGFHAGIIDVPGHEGFVRNMIAGVGSIDLALLVVAADDGWMPQTEEHLQILTYLGVDQGVVALTKADLAPTEKPVSQIRAQLAGTAFAQAPIIATSVRTGAGIEQLKNALTASLSEKQSQRDIGKPRLFVDRAFALHGIGTVVTGTLAGGMFRRGQPITVYPQKLKAHIRSMQNHGRDSESVAPAMRTALNLPELAVGTSPASIKRGNVVAADNNLEPSSVIDVLLEKSDRLNEKDPAARGLKSGTSVYLHHGTARVPANVVFFEGAALEKGKAKIAQLRLDWPVLAFLGDRFVVRDRSEQRTIAGGIVLDPAADRKQFRSTAQRNLLLAHASAPNDVDVCVGSEIERRGPMKTSALLRKSHFSAEEIFASWRRLELQGKIAIFGEIAANTRIWRMLRDRATKLIDDAHKKSSERAGLDINELRGKLQDQPLEVVESIVADLCQDGFKRTGSIIARSSHQAVLPSHLESTAADVLRALSAKPFDPPSRKQVAADKNARHALQFLIEQGEIVEVGPDLVLLRDAFMKMKETVAAFISKNGPATVSDLRQMLQTSRRTIVPFLERLDRERVTQRMGDQRILIH